MEVLIRRDWGLLEKTMAEADDMPTIASCYHWAGRFLSEEGKWKEAHTAFQASLECWLKHSGMFDIPRNLKQTRLLKEAIQAFGVHQEFAGLDTWLSSTAVGSIVAAAMNCGQDESFKFGTSLFWLAQAKAEIGAEMALLQTETMCEAVLKACLNEHSHHEEVTTCLGRLYLLQGLKTHPWLHPEDLAGAWAKVQLSLNQRVEQEFALERDYAVYKVHRKAGDFQKALPLIESVVQMAANVNEDASFAMAMYRIDLAECLLHLPEVDLGRVDREVSYGLRYAQTYPHSGYRMIMAYCIKIQTLLARNQLDEAKNVLGIAQECLRRSPGASGTFAENVRLLEVEVAYSEYRSACQLADLGKAVQAIESVVQKSAAMASYSPFSLAIHRTELAECLLRLPEKELVRAEQELNFGVQYVMAHPFSDYRLVKILSLKAEVHLNRSEVADAKQYLAIARMYLEKFPNTPKAFVESIQELEFRVFQKDHCEALSKEDFVPALEAIENILPYVDSSSNIQENDRLLYHLRVAALLIDLESSNWERIDREIGIVDAGIKEHGLEGAVVGVAHLVRGFCHLRRGNIDEAKKSYMEAKQYEMLHSVEFASYADSVKKLEEELFKVEPTLLNPILERGMPSP